MLEYGNINDTMTLLKHISKPSLKHTCMQSLHHNNGLSPEQQPNKLKPMFKLLQRKQRTS